LLKKRVEELVLEIPSVDNFQVDKACNRALGQSRERNAGLAQKFLGLGTGTPNAGQGPETS
jgi:hypothetical protein